MRGRIGILCILFFLSFEGLSNDNWFNGVVVLKTDEVLVGDLSHNSEYNIVQIKHEDRIKTFSAFQVSNFHFHDTDLGIVRRFISIPYSDGAKRFEDGFFELVIKGGVSLVRKEKSFSNDVMYDSEEVYNVNGYTINNFQYQHAMNFDYYFHFEGETIHSDKFKRVLLPILKGEYEKEMNKFIDDEKVNIHNIYDQVRIIKYYNKLTGENQLLTAG